MFLLVTKDGQLRLCFLHYVALHYTSFWQGYATKGICLHCWWKWKHIQSLWKSVSKLLRKIGNNQAKPLDQDIPLLGIHPKNTSIYYRDTCSNKFSATLFKIVRKWRQHTCASAEIWANKLWYIDKIDYYLALTKLITWNFSANKRKVAKFILSKVTQTNKDKHGT